MKKISGTALAFWMALCVAAPATALAWNGPCGGAWEGAGEHTLLNFTPDQRASLEKIVEEYQDKAQALHSEITAKHLELEYLARNSKTEPATISALVRDIKAIQDQALELRKNAAASLQKDLGVRYGQAHALLGRFGYLTGGRRGLTSGYGSGCSGPGRWRHCGI